MNAVSWCDERGAGVARAEEWRQSIVDSHGMSEDNGAAHLLNSLDADREVRVRGAGAR